MPSATIEQPTVTRQKWLTLAAVLGLAYWCFGNLYEAVVFSPNWVQDSPLQLTRLNGFFVRTGPTLYFVPLTMLATVGVWVLLWRNRQPGPRRDYRRASVFAAWATAVNLLIVTTIVPKMFGADFLAHAEELNRYCWAWNALNVVRIALVAATACHAFNAFRKLDRL